MSTGPKGRRIDSQHKRSYEVQPQSQVQNKCIHGLSAAKFAEWYVGIIEQFLAKLGNAIVV
jgi:hypothetical protein